MSDEAPSLLNAASSVRGNTKTILMSLYKSFMDVTDIPNDNPVLQRALILNIQTAKVGSQQIAAPNLTTESDIIRTGLDKLKAINTPVTKASYEKYGKDFNPFEEKISSYTRRMDDTLTQYKQIILMQENNIKAILKQIHDAKDQSDMTKSLPIQRELAAQETKLRELRQNLSAITKIGLATENELHNLHRLVYNALPPAERNTLVSPEEIARARASVSPMAEETARARPTLGGSGTAAT